MKPQKKLRLFLLDEQSGRPARYLRVEAFAEMRLPNAPTKSSMDSHATQAIALGLLQSDHVGYVSFDLSPIFESTGEISRLYVRLAARPDDRHDLPTGRGAMNDQAISVRVRDARAIAERETSLPAVQNPDIDDWTISPRSFSAQAIEVVGQDSCETLLISNAPVQQYGFVQIIREPNDRDEQLQPAEPSPCEPKGNPAPALCFRRGVVVEYEATWQPMGHGLGEVLYSLPLAPCESVKLAIIDWARSDAASRGEDLSVSEQLFHNQRRDRAIEEIVQGTVSEWQRGGSVMGAAGGTYSYGSGTLAASLGAAYSTSAGDRNAAADTVQRLADAIGQASTATRRLQSTVVVQASQSESQQLQTRTVTNHNHCHALTVLYYEIVRHFLVETAAVRLRDAILLRHPEQSFDAARALRNEDQLKAILLDSHVGAGFDAIRRRQPGGASASPPEYGDITRLIVKTTTGDEDTGIDNGSDYVRYFLLLTDGTVKEFRVTDDNRVTDENWLYRRGRTNTLIFALSSGDRLDSIAQVGVGYHRPGERSINWIMAGIEVKAVVPVNRGSGAHPEMVTILRRADANYRFTDGGEWWGDAEIPAQATSAPSDDEQLERQLLDHLNDNRHYYNRALWLAEDPNRRAALLERYRFESSGTTGRLIDFVDNRIIDVVGDYIVLALGTDELAERLIPVRPEPQRRMIGVPTRGAFAEAKLSNCNACEEIDDTRFWDWQESPCACDAPEITGIAPVDRARDATGLESSSLPAASVGIADVPDAPDPTGMAGLLELLGRSDIFRDMSGRAELASVMQSVVNGAVQLQMERLRQQAAAQQRQQTGQAGQSGSGTQTSTPNPATQSTSGTSSSDSPIRARDRAYRQAENAVNRAEQSGALSEAAANAARQQLAESRVQETIADPLATAAASRHDPTPAERPAPGLGPNGTQSNPWIIDNFAVDRAELPQRSTDDILTAQLLDDIAADIRARGDGVVYVLGHADQSGEALHNLNLGTDRANQVALELVDRGIAGGSRMRISSRGESQPRSTRNADSAGHNPYNRRVEIWWGPADAEVTASLTCNRFYASVPLIPQPNKMACWAAATAMMASYQQGRTVTPEMVGRRMGDNLRATFPDTGMARIVSEFGFQTISMPDNLSLVTTAGQWCDWLTRFGPLYVSVIGDPSHAIIVRGLVGSGDSLRVHILNPWDTQTIFDSDPMDFHPANRGRAYSQSFRDFVADFGSLGLADFGQWRILYLPRP